MNEVENARKKHYRSTIIEATKASSNRKNISFYDLEEMTGNVLFVDSFDWPIGTVKYFILADGESSNCHFWKGAKVHRVHLLNFYTETIEIEAHENKLTLVDEDEYMTSECVNLKLNSAFVDCMEVQKIVIGHEAVTSRMSGYAWLKKEEVSKLYFDECIKAFTSFVCNSLPADLLEESTYEYLNKKLQLI